MAMHLLLLLLLFANTAFSIHPAANTQVSQARCLCYSANHAHKQIMRLFLAFALCFIADSLFVGQYSYDYAVPKKLCLD